MSINVHDLVVDCNIPYKRIEDFNLEHEINEHAKLEITLFLEDKEQEAAIEAFKNRNIVVHHRQSDTVYFHGVIKTQHPKLRPNGLYLKLTAFSNSINSDIEKKSRSFQHESQHYDKIFQQISRENKSNYAAIANTERPIGTWLFQNQRTDWEFLKEMARKLKTFIVVDETIPTFNFTVGVRKLKLISSVPEEYSIRRKKDPSGEYIFSCEFQDYINYSIGTQVEIGKIVYQIINRSMKSVKSEIIFFYKANAIALMENLEPTPLNYTGQAISGRVIDRKGKRVKVHLDIDDVQPVEQAVWIPFLPQEGAVAYYMPELGSLVQVYCQNENLSEAIAIHTIRSTPKNVGESEWLDDPSTKLLSNKESKHISMGHDEINVSTIEGSLYAKLGNDIDIHSNTNITMKTPENVHFTNARNIDISAKESIILQARHESSLYLATDVQLRSENVLTTGIDGNPVQGVKLNKSQPPIKGKPQNAGKVKDSVMSSIPQVSDSTKISPVDNTVVGMLPTQLNVVAGSGFTAKQAIEQSHRNNSQKQPKTVKPKTAPAGFNSVQNLSTPVIKPEDAMKSKHERTLQQVAIKNLK